MKERTSVFMDTDVWESLRLMAEERGTTRGRLVNFILAAEVADWKVASAEAAEQAAAVREDIFIAAMSTPSDHHPVRMEDTGANGTEVEATEKPPEGG
jgi:hypothetical protein